MFLFNARRLRCFTLKGFFLRARLVDGLNMLSRRVKMGNVLSQQETRQSLATGTVGVVSGHGANDLSTHSCVNINNRAATNAVNCNAVDQVCPTCGLVSADAAREKAQLIRLYGGITKPANLGANGDGLFRGEQREGSGGDWKLIFLKHDYCGVSWMVKKKNNIRVV